MRLIANVEYLFSGDGWTERLKRKAEKDFIWYYGKFTDVFNSHIEEVNNEWDHLYGLRHMNENMIIIYNNFVTAKMLRYLIDLNKEFVGTSWIVAINPETAMCRIYLKGDVDSYLDFDIQIELPQ